ncbi:MAG: dienelactone hydrolase family protein [Alphaproteobacteria bacterium]
MSEITIKAADGGEFMAYVAKPKAAKAPGVLVIQEVFGVNKFVRKVADWFAAEGFLAVAPDLFWRLEPRLQLDPDVQTDFNKALELFGKYDQEKGVTDLKTTLDAMRKMPGCTGKVGCVGYCLGGRLAYMMAARSTIDASVGYYGVGIDNLLGEKGHIKKPHVQHIAQKDAFVPPAAQQAMHKGLAGHPQVTLYDYPDVDHGFARSTGQAYAPAAAKIADGRTLDFFKKNLA